MAVKLRGERGERIELELLCVETAPQASGDLCLNLRIDTAHFSGQSETWVLAASWASFLHDLRELERSRRGRATLQSINPSELRLELYASDALGHMAFDGEVSLLLPYDIALRFTGIPFSPHQLPSLVRDLTQLTASSRKQ